MKKQIVSMSEVVNRPLSDFIVEYELKENKSYKNFPGCILSFSYDINPTIHKVFCDIFPEFRKSSSPRDLVGPNEYIPSKGKANMWIVSELNRLIHKKAIRKGRTCYLLNGIDVVATCTIIKANGFL
jgi:hypothetical protein